MTDKSKFEHWTDLAGDRWSRESATVLELDDEPQGAGERRWVDDLVVRLRQRISDRFKVGSPAKVFASPATLGGTVTLSLYKLYTPGTNIVSHRIAQATIVLPRDPENAIVAVEGREIVVDMFSDMDELLAVLAAVFERSARSAA
jgi:hypothetical protein